MSVSIITGVSQLCQYHCELVRELVVQVHHDDNGSRFHPATWLRGS